MKTSISVLTLAAIIFGTAHPAHAVEWQNLPGPRACQDLIRDRLNRLYVVSGPNPDVLKRSPAKDAEKFESLLKRQMQVLERNEDKVKKEQARKTDDTVSPDEVNDLRATELALQNQAFLDRNRQLMRILPADYDHLIRFGELNAFPRLEVFMNHDEVVGFSEITSSGTHLMVVDQCKVSQVRVLPKVPKSGDDPKPSSVVSADMCSRLASFKSAGEIDESAALTEFSVQHDSFVVGDRLQHVSALCHTYGMAAQTLSTAAQSAVIQRKSSPQPINMGN